MIASSRMPLEWLCRRVCRFTPSYSIHNSSISSPRVLLALHRRYCATDVAARIGAPIALPLAARRRVSKRQRMLGSSESAPFVDCCRVTARAGDGGNGCVSLGREFGVEMAGPDGGDGGAGGHVLFRATSDCSSLARVKVHVTGAAGRPGAKRNRHGARAENTVIPVPLGTMFRSDDGSIVASVEREGEVFVAARGGDGGRGNKFFASSTQQTPRYAEKGACGETVRYSVELRTIADVGLIGFPNAGKSTLLRAVSRARPRVASYPFTTLRPHVGVVDYSDLSRMTWADIPGLIADAHRNRGLGVAFLRHVQRCSCLLFVLDATDQPEHQLRVLRHELRMFDERLARRAAAVVVNKLDLMPNDECVSQVQKTTELPVLPLSAKFGTNVTELLVKLKQIFDACAERNGEKGDEDVVVEGSTVTEERAVIAISSKFENREPM